MKKQMITLLACVLMAGCSNTVAAAATVATTAPEQPLDANVYTAYANAITHTKNPDSYSATMNNTYKMTYSDNSTELYVMDGTLEASGIADNNIIAHSTQHISSKGTESDLDGWYYDGRLYNTYDTNVLNYYEDMSFSNLKNYQWVPMDVFQIQQNTISSLQAEQDNSGNTIYTIQMNADTAATLFTNRYNKNLDFTKYDGYQITSNTIKDTFDANGYFVKEEADFTIAVTYKNQAINIDYSSYVTYEKLDNTTVSVSANDKRSQATYGNYKDFDTSKITSESLIDDSEESTTEATFKKRLVGRLGYTDNGDGTYKDTFNDSESYTIDFNNKTFLYTNHTIAYSYSWKGDTGSMGACTLIFDTNASSTGCEDTTLSTIKDVKMYLQMELYYCGLSLDDLQAEAK
mgnify:CR=1 FL=1